MAKFISMTGKEIDTTNYSEENIEADEIILSLCRQLRYAGRTNHRWTIAQHMILCSAIADHLGANENHIRAAFLHDIEEGVIQDIVTPIKGQYLCDDFRNDSDSVRATLMQYYNVNIDQINWSFIHDVDQIAYVIECNALRPKTMSSVRSRLDPEIIEAAFRLMDTTGIGIPKDLLMMTEEQQYALISSMLEVFRTEIVGTAQQKVKLELVK